MTYLNRYTVNNRTKLAFLGAGIAVAVLMVFGPLNISPLTAAPSQYIDYEFAGNCYRFTGPSYDAVQYLDKEWQLLAMKLNLQAIEDPNSQVQINFFGSRADVQSFIDKYGVKVLNEKDVPAYIDGRSVFGLITKSKLESIVNRLTADQLAAPILGSVEASVTITDIGPSRTPDETTQIISQLESFRNSGLKQIIDTKLGVMRCG